MGKQTFKFNHRKLDASPEVITAKKALILVLQYFLVSVVLAIVYYVVFAICYDTKEERLLAAENRYLKAEYAEAQRRIDLLDNVSENIRLRDINIYREVFNSELPDYVLESAKQSSLDYSNLYEKGEEALLLEINKISRRSDTEASIVSKNMDAIVKALTEGGVSGAGIPSSVPIRNFSVGQTGASVGMKFNPFFKMLKNHDGIDIVAPVGTEIIAPADGRVKSVSSQRGEGQCITIEHSGGITTEYKHLGTLLVRDGQTIRRGMPIARIGSSGRSFAPHLHYEVRHDGHPMDPVHFFFSDLGPTAYNDVAILGSITGQTLD